MKSSTKIWLAFLTVVFTGLVVLGIGCLYVGSQFISSAGNPGDTGKDKVYKNYVKQSYVIEAVPEPKNVDSFLGKIAEDGKVVSGDFVFIPVNEVLVQGLSYQQLFDQLFIASQRNHRVKAVIFLVNSPGGEVSVCDALYHEIRKLRENNIKVVSYVEGISASGAYYITANSDRIIAAPTSNVGSIGVIMSLFNFEGLADKLGIKQVVVKSSSMKDIGSPFKAMSDEEKRVLQRMIDEAFRRFKDIVREGRKLTEKELERVATGEIWTAHDAKRLGLVDDIGYIRLAVDEAKRLTGVNNPTLITYRREVSFFDLFSGDFSAVAEIKDQPRLALRNNFPSFQLLYQWTP